MVVSGGGTTGLEVVVAGVVVITGTIGEVVASTLVEVVAMGIDGVDGITAEVGLEVV